MASKSRSSSKKRAQGGGRTPNSEPRIQLFKDFGGCNFQLSPREFTLGKDADQEQSDLMMNYVVIQDNAKVSDNKTIESRASIVKLFDAPKGSEFTDASILIGKELYIGLDDGMLMYGDITKGNLTEMEYDGSGAWHHWESFAYADGKIIATTKENKLWTGELGKHSIADAIEVPDPPALDMGSIVPRGKLKVEPDITDECSFRIAIAYSYVNKYGPTKHSKQFSFYANYPVAEWHSGCFARITGSAPSKDIYGIEAVEIYYTVDNSSTLLLAGRTDRIEKDGDWKFNWVGYLDATSMWETANLIAPKKNYTEGVEASRVTCIDSRLYFWGSKKDPQRLWIGGNSGNMLSISPGTGGGYVDVEPGSGQEIRVVDKYKTQSGNSIVTMLCDSENSNREQRFNLVENNISLSNESNMKSWQAEQVSGAVGCKSFKGARVCEDGLYSVSRYGLALTTMTMEYNSQIKANYVSDQIKPVFTDNLGNMLSGSILLEADGVLYLCLGRDSGDMDDILFCYDIALKSWYTYSLGIGDERIIDLIHIDYEGSREGIGIVTDKSIYLLPTTMDGDLSNKADFDVTIQTGELSVAIPQQNFFYLSQLEFRFDYIIGDLRIELTAIDQFGRRITTVKNVSHETTAYNAAEYMRVDQRIQSYQLRITGRARFRLTHFMAKVYTMSSKMGLVWGFDDSQSYRTDGDIHPTFKDYNDIRKAIIP